MFTQRKSPSIPTKACTGLQPKTVARANATDRGVAVTCPELLQTRLPSGLTGLGSQIFLCPSRPFRIGVGDSPLQPQSHSKLGGGEDGGGRHARLAGQGQAPLARAIASAGNVSRPDLACIAFDWSQQPERFAQAPSRWRPGTARAIADAAKEAWRGRQPRASLSSKQLRQRRDPPAPSIRAGKGRELPSPEVSSLFLLLSQRRLLKEHILALTHTKSC